MFLCNDVITSFTFFRLNHSLASPSSEQREVGAPALINSATMLPAQIKAFTKYRVPFGLSRPACTPFAGITLLSTQIKLAILTHVYLRSLVLPYRWCSAHTCVNQLSACPSPLYRFTIITASVALARLAIIAETPLVQLFFYRRHRRRYYDEHSNERHWLASQLWALVALERLTLTEYIAPNIRCISNCQ